MINKFLIIAVSVFSFVVLNYGGSAAEQASLQRAFNADPAQLYWISLPSNYDSQKRYPLFIAVHWYTGSAQEQSGQWWFYTRKKYILLCPQFSDGYQTFLNGEDETLIRIVDEVDREFPIDRREIVLVGYSGGAQFTHRFALKHPQFLKAAGVIAAGSYDFPSAGRNSRTRFYVAVGELDDRADITRGFYQDLKSQGFNAEFKSFPLVGHNLHNCFKEGFFSFLNSEDTL